MQSTKCHCLKDVPLQKNVPCDQCRFKCENKYSNETSIKFSQVCGGVNTYNVFKSGMISLGVLFVNTLENIWQISGTFIKQLMNCV